MEGYKSTYLLMYLGLAFFYVKLQFVKECWIETLFLGWNGHLYGKLKIFL